MVENLGCRGCDRSAVPPVCIGGYNTTPPDHQITWELEMQGREVGVEKIDAEDQTGKKGAESRHRAAAPRMAIGSWRRQRRQPEQSHG
jgi:hypothetical protein